MQSEDSDLRRFFDGTDISPSSIDVYIKGLTETGVSDMADLRSKASVFNLKNIGWLSTDVDTIMAKLFISPEGENLPSLNEENDHATRDELFHRPIKGRSFQTLRRDELIVIKEIGHGASGRVFKALFCPTLTFLAVKVYLFSGS
jgi:hypothetical protein